jgi:hypothetical protein
MTEPDNFIALKVQYIVLVCIIKWCLIIQQGILLIVVHGIIADNEIYQVVIQIK